MSNYKRGICRYKKNKQNIAEFSAMTYEDFIRKWIDPDIRAGDLPTWMSSILKSSKQAEIYHLDDPLSRIVSYADEVWNLLTNKKIIETIKDAKLYWKTKWGWATDIAKYLWWAEEDNLLAKIILWLHNQSAKAKFINKSSSYLGWAVIIWNIKVLVMSTVMATARWLTWTVRLAWGNLINNWVKILKSLSKWDIKWALNWMGISKLQYDDTLKYLKDSWFSASYIEGGKLGWLFEWAYGASAWSHVDDLAKVMISHQLMRKQLLDRWFKMPKNWDVVTAYKNMVLKTTPEDRLFLNAQFSKEISDISDFTTMSRSQIDWMNSSIFSVFKNFGRTSFTKYERYGSDILYNDIVDSVSKNVPIDKADYVKKLWFIWASTVWAYWVARIIIDGISWDSIPEEQKDGMVWNIMWGNPYEILTMRAMMPVSMNGLWLITWWINNIFDALQEAYYDWLSWKTAITATKMSPITRYIDKLMGNAQLTKWGEFKYEPVFWNSVFQNIATFLLWKDNAQLDAEVLQRNLEAVKDKWMLQEFVDTVVRQYWYMQFWIWWTIDKLWAFSSDQSNEWNKQQNRFQSQGNVKIVLGNILRYQDTPMTTEQYILNALDWLDVKFDDNKIYTFNSDTLKANMAATRALLRLTDELSSNINPNFSWDMNAYMNELKDTNPSLFYSIIKKILSPVVVRVHEWTNTIEEMVFSWNETNAWYVDEMIHNAFDAKRLGSYYARQISDVVRLWWDEKNLGQLETLLTIAKNWEFLFPQIKDSLAEVLAPRFKEVQGIEEKIKNFPNIYDIIRWALGLKWIILEGKANDEIGENPVNMWNSTPIIPAESTESNKWNLVDIVKNNTSLPKITWVANETDDLLWLENEKIQNEQVFNKPTQPQPWLLQNIIQSKKNY